MSIKYQEEENVMTSIYTVRRGFMSLDRLVLSSLSDHVMPLCVPAGHCPGPGSSAQSVQLGEDGAESVSVWNQNWNLQLL